MSLATRALQILKDRRDRILRGLINCLPFPFPRFRVWFPGIERARYYLVTANQKIGKSKFADKVFVYDPFFYFLENPQQGSVKVLYFTREMSKEDKMMEFYSHLLYRLSNKSIRISPVDLKSTRADKPVPQKVLDLLESEEYTRYIDSFANTVTFIDDIGNPTGVNKYCRAWAAEHGHFTYTTIKKKDPDTGREEEIEVIDQYIPDDPEQIVIIIFDNASNIIEESNLGKMGSIEKLSKYFVTLRNQLGMSPVLIQHQMQAQEGTDNIKLKLMKPSASGLADCKSTIRDINTAFGLYSPFKFGEHSYEGYNIDMFRNNIRFMEIIDDRDNGAGGLVCPLYFDGAVGVFEELPRADDKEAIQGVYNFLNRMRGNTLMTVYKNRTKRFFTNLFKKNG